MSWGAIRAAQQSCSHPGNATSLVDFPSDARGGDTGGGGSSSSPVLPEDDDVMSTNYTSRLQDI